MSEQHTDQPGELDDITDDEQRQLLDDPLDGDPADDDPGDPAETAADGGEGSHEAAKYRRRLREAEGERDTLRARLETLQRAEAERLAGQHLASGTDLWTAGTELAALLNDAGDLDARKVTAAAKGIVTERPHWGRGQGRPPGRPTERMRGGSDPTQDGNPTPSWSDLISGGKR